MAEVGYTFEPGRDQKKMLGGINKGKLGPQANEALKVLSLRLPEVLGGSPIAPEDLLRPRVGGSGGGSAVLDSLQQAFGGGAQAPAPLLSGAGSSGRSLNVANFGGGGSPISAPAPDRGVGSLYTPPPPSFTPGDREGQQYAPQPISQPGPVDSRPMAESGSPDLMELIRAIKLSSLGQSF